MCGIAGFVDPDRPPQETACAVLEAMGDALRRRGPDDSGVWYSPETGLGFTHRRLSIHDLSPLGRQPIVSLDGRWILIFNGEIYNFRPIRSRLRANGARLRGESDTEVLLESLALWGVDATLEAIAGMFAFAAYDMHEQHLWLARDRVGEKPLFFGWNGRRFFFASTISAMEAHPGFSGTVNADAVAGLLRYRCVPAPLSIYEGIGKLEPGCCIRLPLGRSTAEITQRRYWQLPTGPEPSGSDRGAASVDDLEDVLRTVVSEQVIADRPLGAFLSGGIDSTVVVATMAEVAENAVKTFTVGFDDPEFDESHYAREVARHIGTDHEEVNLRPNDALEFVPFLAECYDEPFADPSQLPTMMVSRMARERVVVALSGDGGDESFGGYGRYRSALTAWRRLSRYPRGVRQYAAAAMRAAGRPGLDAWLPGALEMLRLRKPGRSAATALNYWANVLDSASLLDLYTSRLVLWRNAEEAVPGATKLRSVVAIDGEAAASGALRSMMAADFRSYLPDDLLVKVDRASMFFGLEVRSPLLDHRVVEVAWRLAEHELSYEGSGKWPLRQLLSKRLPEKLMSRPKRGFAVPLGDWLRGPLREWAEDLLAPERLRDTGVFNAEPIREKWHQHVNGVWDNSAHIWTVLMFMSWQARVHHRDTTAAQEGTLEHAGAGTPVALRNP